jgi:hypothetical protein
MMTRFTIVYGFVGTMELVVEYFTQDCNCSYR